jgi:hypothetical protein
VFGRVRTVEVMQWQRQDVPGALAAWAVAVSALLVVVNPAPMLRAALALLAPAVVVLAFLTSLQQGSCPSCRAPRRLQVRVNGEPKAVLASRTVASRAEVGVDTGWNVDLPVQITCERCGSSRRMVTTRFVSLERAPTSSEAVLIAEREMH